MNKEKLKKIVLQNTKGQGNIRKGKMKGRKGRREFKDKRKV